MLKKQVNKIKADISNNYSIQSFYPALFLIFIVYILAIFGLIFIEISIIIKVILIIVLLFLFNFNYKNIKVYQKFSLSKNGNLELYLNNQQKQTDQIDIKKSFISTWLLLIALKKAKKYKYLIVNSNSLETEKFKKLVSLCHYLKIKNKDD